MFTMVLLMVIMVFIVISVFTDGAYMAPPIPFGAELNIKLHPSIIIVEKFSRHKAPPLLLAVL